MIEIIKFVYTYLSVCIILQINLPLANLLKLFCKYIPNLAEDFSVKDGFSNSARLDPAIFSSFPVKSREITIFQYHDEVHKKNAYGSQNEFKILTGTDNLSCLRSYYSLNGSQCLGYLFKLIDCMRINCNFYYEIVRNKWFKVYI